MDATIARLIHHHDENWAILRRMVMDNPDDAWLSLGELVGDSWDAQSADALRELPDTALLALSKAGIVAILTIMDREAGVPV